MTATAQPRHAPRRDPAVERDRRRFALRQRRRRWGLWRAAIGLVLAASLVAGGVWLVWFSSFLAVQKVEVVGTSALSDAAVIEAAAVPTGAPLAGADLATAQLRVSTLALVRDVEVTRQWPHTVLVTVTERIPVAYLAVGSQLRGLDADGQVLGAVRNPPPGLPRVEATGEASSAALGEAAQVVAALPASLAARVDHVTVATVDRISLELGDGSVVQWGSAEQSAQKAQVLEALLLQPTAAEYDVSVPGLPTTRG